MLISSLLPIEVLRFAYIPFLVFFSCGQAYICHNSLFITGCTYRNGLSNVGA